MPGTIKDLPLPEKPAALPNSGQAWETWIKDNAWKIPDPMTMDALKYVFTSGWDKSTKYADAVNKLHKLLTDVLNEVKMPFPIKTEISDRLNAIVTDITLG